MSLLAFLCEVSFMNIIDTHTINNKKSKAVYARNGGKNAEAPNTLVPGATFSKCLGRGLSTDSNA